MYEIQDFYRRAMFYIDALTSASFFLTPACGPVPWLCPEGCLVPEYHSSAAASTGHGVLPGPVSSSVPAVGGPGHVTSPFVIWTDSTKSPRKVAPVYICPDSWELAGCPALSQALSSVRIPYFYWSGSESQHNITPVSCPITPSLLDQNYTS